MRSERWRFRKSYVAVALVLLPLGCGGAGDAKITDMSSAGVDNAASGEASFWLEMEFGELAPGGDARDVELRLESSALTEPAAYDWHYLAAHDVKFRAPRPYLNSDTSPLRAPKPGETLLIEVPIKIRTTAPQPAVYIPLDAELYWGGILQDTERRTLGHMYR